MKMYNDEADACPFCGNDDLNYNIVEHSVSDGMLQMTFECPLCYGTWDVLYRAFGVVNENEVIDVGGDEKW